MSSTRGTHTFQYSILILSGMLIVFLIPEFASVPTGCLFNKLSGYYCAGCGLSRGLHSLLRGEIYRAAHQNILLVTAYPLSAFWLVLRSSNLKISDRIKKYDKTVILCFIIFVLIFTILRNVPLHFFGFLRPL